MSYIDDLVVPLSRKEVQEMFSSKSEYARIMNDKFRYLAYHII